MADNALLTVRYDHAALQGLARQVAGIRGGLARIVPAALNRTAAWTRTRQRREVASQCRIKVRSADRLLRTEKASAAKWNAQCEILNRRVGIGKFVARGKGHVTAQFPSGLSLSYPRHFRATMPSGHKGVFVRGRVVKPGISIRRPEHVGRNKRGWYKYRTELPIYEQRERLGIVMRLDWLPALQAAGMGQLQKEIDSKIAWLTAKGKG